MSDNDYNMNGASETITDQPTGDTTTQSAYDRLKGLFTAEVSIDPITLEVPLRKGLAIRFDPTITMEQVEQWRKQSVMGANRNQRRRASADETNIDPMKMAALVVFSTAEVFLVDGEEVFLPGDEPLNFHNQDELKQIFGLVAATNTELVRKVFGNDAHVVAASTQIMDAAGFGDDLDEADAPN